MSRKFYCAQCGVRMIVLRKAVQGQTIDLVEPHSCNEIIGDDEIFEIKEVPEMRKAEVDKMFKGFDFVQKINKAEVESVGLKDLRPKREELEVSSAPLNTLDAMKANTPTMPTDESGGFEDE